MPEAAIIIPHYNDVTRLQRCLAALFQNDLSNFEIVVVDNGSSESLDVVRAGHPDLRIVTEPIKGAAAARNRGVSETTASRLFFLDADCLPAPGWPQAALNASGRADLVGGAVDVFDETPPPRTGAQAFEQVFGFDYRSYIEKEKFSVTANLLTRRDVFEDVGPFATGNAEDMDWCWRARDKSYSIICAEDVRVSHPSRSDWASLERKWRRLTEERMVLNGTQGAARARWILRALAMPVSIPLHVTRILRHPNLVGSEKLAALATLVRLRFRRMGWMLALAAGRNL